MGFCYLMDLETKTEWELIAIKDSSQSFDVSYDPIQLVKSTAQPYLWKNTSNEIRSFTVGLDSRYLPNRISATEAYKRFQSFCKPSNSRLSPAVLSFVWNKEIFSPCIISGSVRFNEKILPGGEIGGELSFTLVKIPEGTLTNKLTTEQAESLLATSNATAIVRSAGLIGVASAVGGSNVPTGFISLLIEDDNLLSSAFVVGANRVATVKHNIVGDPNNISLVVQGTNKQIKAKMIAFEGDAAILSTTETLPTPMTLGEDPPVGATLTSFGHKFGVKEISSSTIKTTVINQGIILCDPVSSEIVRPGYSGGCIVDNTGKVVGSNSEANPQGKVKMIPISVYKTLLTQ